MPPAVERLARKYMRKPIVINIGRAGQATDNVTQRILMVKENEKASRLEQVCVCVEGVRLVMLPSPQLPLPGILGGFLHNFSQAALFTNRPCLSFVWAQPSLCLSLSLSLSLSLLLVTGAGPHH